MTRADRTRVKGLPARHERFAVALAAGMTVGDAYAAAGFRPHRGNASRLSANERVQSRVSEIQSRAARRAVTTVDHLLHELEAARLQALSQGHTGAAVAASMGKAKLVGLVSGARPPAMIEIDPAEIAALDDDQVEALIAAIPVLRQLGIMPAASNQGGSHDSR